MSKTDDEINRLLILNSGGANPEDYLTPKQFERYKKYPKRFIDIDIDLVMNEKEEEKYPEPDWEQIIDEELSKPRNKQLNSGVAAPDYTLDLLGASLLPQTRAVAGAINTTRSAIDFGKKVWNSPIAKPVRQSDFVQNWMKDPTKAGNLQRTINAEQVVDDMLAIPSSLFRRMSRIVKDSGISGKDLANSFGDLTEIFNQQATVNFDDKALDVTTWTVPEDYLAPRQNTVSSLSNSKFWRSLNPNEKIQAQSIITNLENYHQKGLAGENTDWWKASRPTRGYRGGARSIVTQNGRELGIGWSNRNQNYYLFDINKNKKSLKKRYYADKPADDIWSKMTRKARLDLIKNKNKNALEALERIKTTNPNLYLDIVGSMSEPDTVWTVEHINARTSGQWVEQPDGKLKHKFKTKKDGSALYFGDADNLMPATGTNYGRLKTNIEKHLEFSDYYVEINPKSRNFYLVNRKTNKPVSFRTDGKIVEIHGMTPSGRWKNVLDHVMGGGDTIGLVESNPEVPQNIALTQPGIIGKDLNERVDPTSGNPTQYVQTDDEYIIEAIENNLELGEQQLAFYWKEILDDHVSGREVLDINTYTRYLKKYNRLVLKATKAQKELNLGL